MKTLTSTLVLLTVFYMSLPAARGQILEGASVYSKATGLGAGLGAAVGATMKHATNGPAPVLTPEQREQAEKNSRTLERLAEQELRQGHKERAAEVYWKLGDWRAQTFGERDRDAQDYLSKSGDMFVSQKNYKAAEQSYRRALSCGVKTWGPGALELLPTLNKLAETTHREHNLQDSDEFCRQSAALSERYLGSRDERTVQARQRHYAVLQDYAQQLKNDNRLQELQAVEQRMSALRPPDAGAQQVKAAPAVPSSVGQAGAAPGGTASGGMPPGDAAPSGTVPAGGATK